MNTFHRSTLRVSSLFLMMMLGTSAAAAQGKPLEIRVDFASAEFNDGTSIDVEFPGSLAMAFYMTRQFAIEPAVIISNFSDDDFSGTAFGAGLFLPFYFKADEGRSGPFLSPGVAVSKATGDIETDTMFDYGVDFGFKFAVKERISTRFALTYRDGDSHDKAAFGGSFGIGFFWR
jgi:hypothetical protein